MQPISRLEMIVAFKEVQKITKVLDEVDVPGYSIISNVIGKGEMGKVSDDVNLGSSKLSNAFIICYCSPDKVAPIAEKIKPILNKYGGVCYLLDARPIN